MPTSASRNSVIPPCRSSWRRTTIPCRSTLSSGPVSRTRTTPCTRFDVTEFEHSGYSGCVIENKQGKKHNPQSKFKKKNYLESRIKDLEVLISASTDILNNICRQIHIHWCVNMEGKRHNTFYGSKFPTIPSTSIDGKRPVPCTAQRMGKNLNFKSLLKLEE